MQNKDIVPQIELNSLINQYFQEKLGRYEKAKVVLSTWKICLNIYLSFLRYKQSNQFCHLCKKMSDTIIEWF